MAGRFALTSGSRPRRGVSAHKLAARVTALGERLGLVGLSPHDLRHYAATLQACRFGDLLAVQE